MRPIRIGHAVEMPVAGLTTDEHRLTRMNAGLN